MFRIYATVKEQYEEIGKKAQLLQEELDKYKQYNEMVVKKMEELNEQIKEASKTKEDEIAIAKLQRLIQLNENMKQQEIDFKASCKKQLGELKDMIANLQTVESSSEELQQYAQVSKAMEADREKNQKIKAALAQKNRVCNFTVITMNRKLQVYKEKWMKFHPKPN